MLAYQAKAISGRECPHCEHVIGPGEDPTEHVTTFHGDRLEAEAKYRAAIASGCPEAEAQAAYNQTLMAFAPGPGRYHRQAVA